ncbi:phosphotransferase enzyme family protein [Raineyella sp. W15-4]|uniref:phosphotransferase enzyme family protein n=1 Tax=Raineyella sp. W15-4 TaxID=3081651 RepID=UPI0029531ACC|nr:phosphotransferase [Raineyella sp. W15-4]WOQ16517.1 phosphotransferase [Raineyella sp. W15-4]
MTPPAAVLDLASDRATCDRIAALAAARHGFPATARLDLLAVSENATYRVSVPGTAEAPGTADTAIVRVHRPGYHDAAAIAAELDWLDELSTHPGLEVIRPRRLPDGQGVISVQIDGTERYAVLFEVVEGSNPDEAGLTGRDFRLLGRMAATLHECVAGRGRDVGRFAWDWEHTLGRWPRWGRWQDGPRVTAGRAAAIAPAVDLLRERLAGYGMAPQRYGLIHADLRLANLLRHGDRVTVIDFDDCGLGWFLYDFASAVSFLETDPRVPAWQEAWLAGYREVRDLGAADEAMLPSFVLLRRLMLLAWLGSHPHAVENATHLADFAEGTVRLASAYLATGGARRVAA